MITLIENARVPEASDSAKNRMVVVLRRFYLSDLVVFIFLFVSPEVVAQGSALPIYRGPGKIVTPLTFGMDIVNNQDLNKWLTDNGVNASDKFAYNYGLKFVFAGRAKSMYGIDLKVIQSSHPRKSDIYFSISYGRDYKFKRTHIIPMIGIGGNTEVIAFDSSVPPPLAQLNVPGAQLLQKELAFYPNVIFHKHIRNSFYGMGIELGCRIYFLQSVWTYGGNRTNQNIKVPEVPNSSTFHPYVSIYFALDVGKKR